MADGKLERRIKRQRVSIPKRNWELKISGDGEKERGREIKGVSTQKNLEK